jgi:hypothetical protein
MAVRLYGAVRCLLTAIYEWKGDSERARERVTVLPCYR